MATYLQGVTDYIPQYQPFQPDLNFYNNVLQTKQTQYDTNWKALNKMYGQYYHADLTRNDSIEKKDNYLKQIEFNLQRVSQLDLSLEQNVDQATQIFKPFYEDKGLMKDMAWTKNFTTQVGRAEGLKGSNEASDREQYWNDGVAAMNFKRDEFKEASAEDALSFENASYTPYVNSIAKAQEVAKEAGLSIESVDFSKDGKWIVKTKNGEQLIEPLQRLFEARLGNDPAIQEVYKTQAYVNRKNEAYANAAQFNGDKNIAELKYLEKSYNVLKAQSTARFNDLKERSTIYNDKINDLQKQVDEGTASPEVKKALDQYKMNKQINDDVLARAENEQKDLSPGQFTVTTSTGFTNPYGDIKSLRYKVDNGMASILMQKDLDEAANIFAYKDAKTDIDANPYAVLADKHRYSMQEVAARNAGLANAARIRNAGERETALMKWKLDSGAYYQDEETGEIKPVEALNEMYVDPSDKGTATDKLNMKNASRFINKLQTETIAKPYLTNTLALIERMVSQNKMSRQDASHILGYGKNPNISPDLFHKKLNKYGAEWLHTEVGGADLGRIEKKMSTWLSQNGQLSGLNDEAFAEYQKSAVKFNDYSNYLKADADWRKTTSYEVEKDLRRQGFKGVDYLYDNHGNLRSKNEFYNALSKAGIIDKEDANKGKTYKPQERGFFGSIGPGNWLDMAVEKYTGSSSIDYDDLVKAAGGVYTSGRIKKSPPGFAQLGQMTGSGKFSPGITSTWVNPKVHGSKSSMWASEVFRDLNKMDWGANDKNRVTFGGISRNNWDKRGELGSRNDVGKALFDLMKGELTKPKSKMGNFRVGVAPVAIGSLNKSAIIIHPDAVWLKQYVKTGKDGKGSGLISEGEYNMIMKNGVSYITDASNMTNSMYTSAFQSPLQSYVDYYGKYTYTDPTNENYKYSIQKNKLGTGDYTTVTAYPLWNPEENKYVYTKVVENTTSFGGNLETNRDMMIDQLNQNKEFNKLLFNGNY
jgi:hypothetical protein